MHEIRKTLWKANPNTDYSLTSTRWNFFQNVEEDGTANPTRHATGERPHPYGTFRSDASTATDIEPSDWITFRTYGAEFVTLSFVGKIDTANTDITGITASTSNIAAYGMPVINEHILGHPLHKATFTAASNNTLPKPWTASPLVMFSVDQQSGTAHFEADSHIAATRATFMPQLAEGGLVMSPAAGSLALSTYDTVWWEIMLARKVVPRAAGGGETLTSDGRYGSKISMRGYQAVTFALASAMTFSGGSDLRFEWAELTANLSSSHKMIGA